MREREIKRKRERARVRESPALQRSGFFFSLFSGFVLLFFFQFDGQTVAGVTSGENIKPFEVFVNLNSYKPNFMSISL